MCFKLLFCKILSFFIPKVNRQAYLLSKMGVSIKDYKTTYISSRVKVSKIGVYIEDGVSINGETVIEDNVKILKGSLINNSIVSKGSKLGPYVYINDSRLGEENNIGPFSYTRPGTHTSKNVKIGGFVEVKNTKVDENSKIPHLSYIGDTQIGKNVNIGAGVITCNYDGVKKSKTLIGDNVFIGSDCQLIAPVQIDKNSYVAAGSTINKNVDEFDLAISRSKQMNKKNYAKKIRG